MPSAECLEKETNTLALSSKLFKQPSLGTKVERKLVKNGVHPLHLKWKEKLKKKDRWCARASRTTHKALGFCRDWCWRRARKKAAGGQVGEFE